MVIKPAAELELVGGAPVLELVNTQEGPRDGEPGHDFLRDYGELVAWAEHVGIVDGAAALAAEGRRRPEAAARVLDDTRALRAAAHAVFSAVANHGPPPAEPLAQLDAAYADAIRHARLSRVGPAHFEHAWADSALERPLWPLAVSAVDLLRTGPLDRLKACDACRWLFLDLSRNHSRRWCTMNICGASAKMRRYRARQRYGRSMTR